MRARDQSSSVQECNGTMVWCKEDPQAADEAIVNSDKAVIGADLSGNSPQRCRMPHVRGRGPVDAEYVSSLDVAVYRVDPVFRKADALNLRRLGVSGTATQQQRDDGYDDSHEIPPF